MCQTIHKEQVCKQQIRRDLNVDLDELANLTLHCPDGKQTKFNPWSKFDQYGQASVSAGKHRSFNLVTIRIKNSKIGVCRLDPYGRRKQGLQTDRLDRMPATQPSKSSMYDRRMHEFKATSDLTTAIPTELDGMLGRSLLKFPTRTGWCVLHQNSRHVSYILAVRNLSSKRAWPQIAEDIAP